MLTGSHPPYDRCAISDAWCYKGMQTVILDNALLRVTVLVDKGGDIVEFYYKPTGTEALFMMPSGIRNPKQDTPSISQSPFLDYYSGGWNEILPNGGPPARASGAEYGQHGEISLVPWRYAIIEDTPERVSVRLCVEAVRTPIRLEKTLTLTQNRAVLTVTETLTNVAAHPLPLMWGHHIAFGGAFLAQGAVVDVPPCHLEVHEPIPDYEPRRFQPRAQAPWPHITTPEGNLTDASAIPAPHEGQYQEMAYLTGLTDGWYALTNHDKTLGFGLRFDHTLFKYVWYWQQLGYVAKGYPWWGRVHTVALEPWTSYPTNGLAEAITNGTALILEPNTPIHTQLHAVAYHDIASVAHITVEGDVVAKETP